MRAQSQSEPEVPDDASIPKSEPTEATELTRGQKAARTRKANAAAESARQGEQQQRDGVPGELCSDTQIRIYAYLLPSPVRCAKAAAQVNAGKLPLFP
jgi:hypothetical protein